MPRALTDILTELNGVYNPKKDVINQQTAQLDPSMQAEQKGLDAAKQDAFGQITDQANRRGLFYSGIPIAEEQKYTGASYLPAVANLKSRYAQQRFNLQDALAKITSDQYNQAYGIRQGEMDNESRIEAARIAAQSRGGGAAAGFSPTFGGFGGGAPQGGGQVQGASQSYRQHLQEQANAGDWNSQVGLNYLDDNGKFDGPVNSKAEYDILKAMGAKGNFYVRPAPGPSIGSRIGNALSSIRPGTNSGAPTAQQRLNAQRAAGR